MRYAESLTLLIVDDRDAEVEQLRRDLASSSDGPTPVTILDARDEQAALAVALGTTVDVIVLALRGREDDARAALARLAAAAPEATIVVATEPAREAMAFRLVQGGAQGYVIVGADDGRLMWRVIRQAVEREARARRREGELSREHAARLAAEQAFQAADLARANAEAVEKARKLMPESGTSAAITTTSSATTIRANTAGRPQNCGSATVSPRASFARSGMSPSPGRSMPRQPTKRSVSQSARS